MSQVIALVDDDRNILTSVSIALQAEGFVTRVYSDGEAALKALADNPPDLGVFDIKMPRHGRDGAASPVREISSMPVIFLTSKDDELDEALGLAMGADDYIAKPFSQRLLIARIRAILRRQELARGEAAADDRRARAAAARARPAGDGPGAPQGALGRQGRHPDRHRVPDPRSAGAAARRREDRATSCWTSPIRTTSMSTTARSTATSSASAASSARVDPDSTRSRPSMASDTASTRSDEADLALSWSGRWTLAPSHPRGQHPHRRCWSRSARSISTCFRNRLSKERTQPDADRSADDRAGALSHVPPRTWPALARDGLEGYRRAACGSTGRMARCWPTAGS